LKTVYILKDNPPGSPAVLQAVNVKIGMTDGSSAEVLEGLEPGAVLVTGLKSTSSTATAPAGNPFGGPFGGPRR
jgi:hypothetical protein